MNEAWIVGVAVLISQPAAAAPAPEAEPALEPETPSLEITLLPGVWLPRLDGDSALGPAGSRDIDLSFQFDLDSMEPTFNAELAVRVREVWEIIFSGTDFSTDSTDRFVGNATFGPLTLSHGDPFRATFDITSFSAELAVDVYRPFTADPQRVTALENRTAQGEYIVDLRVSPALALRYIDVEQTVTVADGSRADADGEWVGILAGVQITLDYRPQQHVPMLEMLRMQGSLLVGPALGGDGGTIWQVRGGFTLQVTEQVGFMFGYRLLETDVENDDYSLNGGLQGLFLAGSLRF
ncbi:MAG: hypothetical protein ACYS0G_06740 [Planctomycetota bacterium]|jgi:hypothetical protein